MFWEENKVMVDKYEKILKDFSAPRMAVYKNLLKSECGYKEATNEQFYNLYSWSELLNSYFWRCLARVETILRNRINDVLVAKIGSDWVFPKESDFLQISFRKKGNEAIEKALSNITKADLRPNNGRIVAELTMGFWVNFTEIRFLHKDSYKKDHRIGWEYFISDIFPGYTYPNDKPSEEYQRRFWLKEGNIKDNLVSKLIFLNILRNRIAHHEHTFKERNEFSKGLSDGFLTNIQRNYLNVLEVFRWLSPEQCDLYQRSHFHYYANYLMSKEGFDYHVLSKRKDMKIDDFTEIAMSSMDDSNLLRERVIHVVDKNDFPIGVFVPFFESQK
ncbi:Abi family protein [Psychrobacter glaciei]|uniref:Abi family protein n=1 Tax=Psychrobacter glaciei TaxID=619771 RepID=UPI003F478C67